MSICPFIQCLPHFITTSIRPFVQSPLNLPPSQFPPSSKNPPLNLPPCQLVPSSNPTLILPPCQFVPLSQYHPLPQFVTMSICPFVPIPSPPSICHHVNLSRRPIPPQFTTMSICPVVQSPSICHSDKLSLCPNNHIYQLAISFGHLYPNLPIPRALPRMHQSPQLHLLIFLFHNTSNHLILLYQIFICY